MVASNPHNPVDNLTVLPLRGAIAEFTRFRDRECVISGGAGTGKSYGVCAWLLTLIAEYPGMRVLMGRKTRASMTQSILVTWERVLHAAGLEKVYSGQQRSHRSSYIFPNGAEVVVAGFDDPERIKSTEYDVIFINEGTEISQDDWEIALSRLRNGKMPWQMAAMDCNPGAPTHWIRGRVDSGLMKEFVSIHKDNPLYWSRDTGDWTKVGRMYYEGALQGLTGVRRSRLLLGQWVASEGAVFEDCWDRSRHVVKRSDVPELHSYYACVDWGYRHPGVISVYGVDSDGVPYRVMEIYRQKKTIYWWHSQAKRLSLDYDIQAWVCDSEEPEHIEQWNMSGMYAVPAIKGKDSIMVGVRLIESALATQGNGRCGLYFVEDAGGYYDDSEWSEGRGADDPKSLADAAREPGRWDHLEAGPKYPKPDTGLGEWIPSRCELQAEDNNPVCTEDEFYVYSYEKTLDGRPAKEKPKQLYDDGISALRYMLRYLQTGVMPEGSGDVEIHFDPAVEEMMN